MGGPRGVRSVASTTRTGTGTGSAVAKLCRNASSCVSSTISCVCHAHTHNSARVIESHHGVRSRVNMACTEWADGEAGARTPQRKTVRSSESISNEGPAHVADQAGEAAHVKVTNPASHDARAVGLLLPGGVAVDAVDELKLHGVPRHAG